MTTFALTGYTNRYHDLRLLEEDGLPLSEDIDAKKICDRFTGFYRMAIDRYGRVDWIFPDSAEDKTGRKHPQPANEPVIEYTFIPPLVTLDHFRRQT